MDLGRQWNERIRIWTEYLPRLFFTEYACCSVRYFTTMERFSLEEVSNHQMYDACEGMEWGKKWEYGWFSFSVKIPASLVGKRIVCRPDTGGESLVFVNGKAAGAFDKKHDFITLTRSAKGGEIFNIVVESYAGHGIRPENGGPYAVDEIPIPEPSEKQVKVGHICFGVWNEDIYQTAIDEFVLYRLLSILPEESLRAQKVAQALKQFTLIADFELEEGERTKSILEARKVLQPVLKCVNGSTSPFMSIFGQSHLDLAWLWPLEETKRKSARTYSTQLALMEEYPEYRFLACEPYLLDLISQNYPELYSRILEKNKTGQIFADGVFWVESDANIPCGEALIRQILRGRAYFKNKLNADSKMAWLPDTFGFSASLPQIFKSCGVEYFATQKLLRCDPECEQFPFNNFWWEGIDGTRILSHIYKKNNAVIEPVSVWERWNKDRNQKEDIDSMMFPFGYGDGGGGPTRTMLECARRMENLEGLPRLRIETPSDFFERLKDKTKQGEPVKNVYSGELYLAWHRGTYTSQSKIKRYSRQAENALHCAEFWTALLSSNDYPKVQSELDDLWKKLLFCQFHDVIPGTSIKRVCDEAEKDLQAVIEGAKKLSEKSALSVMKGTTTARKTNEKKQLFALNTLSWTRNELVFLPEIGKYIEVSVPSCGWAKVQNATSDDKKTISCRILEKDGFQSVEIENDFLKVSIDKNGELTSVYDVENGFELCKKSCNHFCMYKDVTPFYDAWELSPMYKDAPVELEKTAKIEVIEQTNSFVRIKLQKRIHKSELTQIITMRGSSRRIDFETEIDWNEKHKILKVEFPLDIQTDNAISETQFGHIKRSVHTSTQHERDRYEVCNHRYTALADASHGAAVLNDCKYGISVQDKIISLSLLRAPVIPDMYADQGVQNVTYSLYVFNGSFESSGTVREAYNLNSPLQFVQIEDDVAIAEKEFFTVDNPHIVLETVKPAEDSSGNIVLRLYESSGGSEDCIVNVFMPLESYSISDMEENSISKKEKCKDGRIELKFHPFEIKTVLLEGLK